MTKVLNEVTLEVPPGCGSTDGYRKQRHEVYYLRNMMEAQDALRLIINNAQDLSAALAQGRSGSRYQHNKAQCELIVQFAVGSGCDGYTPRLLRGLRKRKILYRTVDRESIAEKSLRARGGHVL